MDVKSLTIWRDLLAAARPDRVGDIEELTARINKLEEIK